MKLGGQNDQGLSITSDKYCIHVTSSRDENLCQHYIANAGPWNYPGGIINLKLNGEIVTTIPRTVFEIEALENGLRKMF